MNPRPAPQASPRSTCSTAPLVWITVLLLFISVPGRTQFYQLKNLNSENGLPSPEVYGMCQDSKGYLWFATDMGVSRYDGYEFRNFSTDNGLTDNTVFGIFEDARNRIWFRSFSGRLSYFSGDTILAPPCNTALEKVIQQNMSDIVISIYVDRKDTIWLGMASARIIRIAPPWKETDVACLPLPFKGPFLLMMDPVHSLLGGGNGNTITVYSPSMQTLAQVHATADSTGAFKRRHCALLLPDSTFLMSIDDLIVHFDRRNIRSAARISGNVIAMRQDKEGRLWVGSTRGVYVFSSASLGHYETIPDVSDMTITDLLIDRENTVWLTAEGQGLYYIPHKDCRYYTVDQGLPKSKITCVGQGGAYTLVGHLNGTVSILSGDSIRSAGQGLAPGGRVFSIFDLSPSDFYIGGISCYELTGNNLDRLLPLPVRGIKKVIRGRGDSLWILSSGHILNCIRKPALTVLKDIPFPSYTDDIYMTRDGTLWICAVNGIWTCTDGSLRYLGDAYPLLRNRIVQLLEDEKGRIWMASRGSGVIVKDGGRFYQVRSENGLASNMCRNMMLDTGGVAWVGSNNGLSKITLDKGTGFAYSIELFSSKTGLLTNEVNFVARLGNKLMAVHNSGISIFDPRHPTANATPPPIYISGVTVNNQVLHGDTISFIYNANYITVGYTGLSYKNPGNIRYRYRMEGLDSNWVYTAYTSAQFQALAPGNYRFIVYAQNGGGHWSDHPAVLRLHIIPVWWQTWTFRLAVVLAVLALLYAVARSRIAAVRKREHEKAELHARVVTTELKALRAQMNPHFVFNAINSVQHFITSNDPKSSQRYLAKFAKLIRYVVDNSKLTTIPLEKELEALQLFLDLESLRFENKFDYSIHVDKRIDRHFIRVPSMLIQPYVENAIWHGLMHKKEKGRIDLRVELLETGLLCTVEDNGIGRKRSLALKQSLGKETHASVGMAITQDRLEIINQLHHSHLNVKVIDLKDEKGEAAGTRVELFIPFH